MFTLRHSRQVLMVFLMIHHGHSHLSYDNVCRLIVIQSIEETVHILNFGTSLTLVFLPLNQSDWVAYSPLQTRNL